MRSIINLILIIIVFFISALIFKILIQFNNHDYLYSLKILIVLIIAIVFYICALIFFNKEWKLSIIISSIAIIFALYSFEIYFKLTKGDSNPYIMKSQILAKSIDGRSKIQVIKDLRNKGKKVHTTINPLKDVSYEAWMGQQGRNFFPLSGISNTLTIFCNELGFWSSYTSDKYGFNNPNEAYNNNPIDVILIGDSFVHGACIKQDQDIASNLRSKNLNVINLGYGGNGPLTELATLMEYAIHYQPKDVFWFFFRGDMADLHKEYSTKFLYKYIIEDNVKNSLKKNTFFTQNLINRQKEVDQYLISYIKKEEEKIINKDKEYSFRFFDKEETKNKLKIKDFLYHFFQINNEIKTDLRFLRIRRLLGLVDKNKNECLDFTCSHYLNIEFPIIIDQARNVVESWNGNFHFVYLPSWWEYSDYKKNYINNKKMVLEVLKKLDINIIDFNDYLIKNNNPQDYYAFSLPNHYNKEGYSLISEQLFEYLEK